VIRELLDAGLMHDVAAMAAGGLREHTREPWMNEGQLAWRDFPSTPIDASIVRTAAEPFSGTGGLTKAGSGTLTLSGSNSYTGATTVNAGTLVFGKTSAKAAGNLTATAAATVGLGVGAGSGDYSDANVAALFNTTLAGFSLDPASGVAVDTTAGNFTQQTALTAPRALTKLGANTLTLTGANTYSGTTTVSLGTLVVTNSTLTATISSNSVAVAFASAPSTGMTYTVLPGALATNSLGTTPVVTGLGSGQSATVTNDPNLVVQVTSSDPTFEDTYPSIDPLAVNPANGLTYLMNYALGGTGPNSTPALPVLTVDGNGLTLTATVRNDDPRLRFYGQWTTDLSGTTDSWEDHTVELTPPDLSFSQDVETNKPRKFMRLKVTRQ
jgi:autotransporter-associated beta strand protein